MDNSLPNNNLGEKHALELYHSQELRQAYLKKRNQFTLRAAGLLLAGVSISTGVYFFTHFLNYELQRISLGATIFISVISFLAYLGYQSQFVYKKRVDFIQNFKSEVIQKILKSLYPKFNYSRSANAPLAKLLKTNRYSSYSILRSRNSQDAISGHYPDFNFLMLESTIYGASKFDDEETYRKIFTGLIIHIRTNQTKKDINNSLSSTAVKKKLDALSKFWGSYPQVTSFHSGEIIIDIVLLKRHFLEPPKKGLSIYDPIYLQQLEGEIGLLAELIEAIRKAIATN
jgi:hypothetical protein